jgi:hypothetical protein
MKSYPYIGELKNDTGGVVLFARDSYGAQLNCKGKNWENKDTNIYGGFDWDEDSFKNITAEYLANTYGEVKSKEHAEFIVKLCNSNGIRLKCESVRSKSYWFMIIGDGLYFYPSSFIPEKNECKPITIPLPPECESVDEWPKVGDTVTWGTKAVNGEIKGIDGELAWIRNDNGNHNTVYISELEKPKTPEQELRDFLHLLWRENNEDFDDFADIAILHLKKKGEGDELH